MKIKANDLDCIYNVLTSINRKNFITFCTVVSWYQIHNNLNYFFNETENKKIFIDLSISASLCKSSRKFKSIKADMINYVIINLNFDSSKVLLNLAEASYRSLPLKDLNNIAKLNSKSY